MSEPETGVLPGTLKPIRLYVCYRGVCPPRTERGACYHGRLEPVNYVPAVATEELIALVRDRIVDACNVCGKLPEGFDRDAAHGYQARQAVDAIVEVGREA